MKQLQKIKTLFKWASESTSVDEKNSISELLKVYINDLNKELLINAQNIASELTHEEIHAGKFVGKLECVKLYKNRTGCGLIDAKKTVENFFDNNALVFYRPQY